MSIYINTKSSNNVFQSLPMRRADLDCTYKKITYKTSANHTNRPKAKTFFINKYLLKNFNNVRSAFVKTISCYQCFLQGVFDKDVNFLSAQHLKIQQLLLGRTNGNQYCRQFLHGVFDKDVTFLTPNYLQQQPLFLGNTNGNQYCRKFLHWVFDKDVTFLTTDYLQQQ